MEDNSLAYNSSSSPYSSSYYRPCIHHLHALRILIMAFRSNNETVNDENIPLSGPNHRLPPTEEGLLQEINPWMESFHNLRYGIVPRKKPEEIMTYRGIADHRKEADLEMDRRYQRFINERRHLEYLKWKMEEEQAEAETKKHWAEQEAMQRQRSRAQQAAILGHSRQNAMLAREQTEAQFNAPNAQYDLYPDTRLQPQGSGPLYAFVKPPHRIPVVHEGHFTTYPVTVRKNPDSPAASIPSNQQAWQRHDHTITTTVKDEPNYRVNAAHSTLLDESITSSPTYRSSPAHRFVAERDHTGRTRMQSYKATGGYRAAAGPQSARTAMATMTNGSRAQAQDAAPNDTTSSARYLLSQLAQNMVQPPTSMPNQLRQQASQPYFKSVAAFTPAPTPDEDDIVHDQIEVIRNTRPGITAKFSNGPTPPAEADADEDQEMLDDNGFPSDEAQPATPTLSDIIGSETPSEEEVDDEDDGDWDFDPKSPSPPPPAHREVKGFGMRTRRLSSRARR